MVVWWEMVVVIASGGRLQIGRRLKICPTSFSGGRERGVVRADSFILKSKAIIADFPDSPYRRALAAVAELITERDH